MNFIYKILFSLSLVLVLFSCDEELLELNENPNQPSEVTPGVLLTAGTRAAINSMVTESFLLGNNAAQLTAKTLRAEIDIYNWNAFPTVWEEQYRALTDIIELERVAIEQGNEQMEGVALVMKSYIFSVLTDAYGDIPYTEAAQGIEDGNFTPAYDAQEDIYFGPEGLLAELDRADDLLNTGNAGSITGDILFSGDVTMWKKWANSLRLRLLMHASTQMDVSAEISALVQEGNLMTSNNDNAVLTYTGSFPNEYPLIPLKQGDFDAVVMSNRSVGVMQQYDDPRLSRYARPDNLDFSDPTFSGAENGSENASLCDKTGSRLGVQYYNYPGQPITFSSEGLPVAEGVLQTYAEVEFLLAEAAARGFISDDVEMHYRNGIQASMDYHQVDYAPFGYADFDDYYANSGVAYAGEAIQIWEQKWLALFFHGLEPYFEIRRWLFENDFDLNAIPFLSPTCENVNDDRLPVRFLYPGQEQSLNAENYDQAVSNLGGSNSFNARIWLLQ